MTDKPECPAKAHVVKAEWFWTSIQMDTCPNEKLHLFEEMVSIPMTNIVFEVREKMTILYFLP